MQIAISSGKYIVAVSGGVDSMTLLHMLHKNPELELVVAHFNHGIRDDSGLDEALVLKAAKEYGLFAESARGNLGKLTSEEAARKARYKFLEAVKAKHQARAIITAHHRDDLLETAIINIMRGTGPQGLVSIDLNPNIKRPLIHYNKRGLVDYAKKNNLAWREDTTNNDLTYLRNYIRKEVLSRFTKQQKQVLLLNIDKVAKNSQEKINLTATISQFIVKNEEISRAKFVSLPSELGSELLIYWLRNLKVKDYDRKMVARLNEALRTGLPGTKYNLNKNNWLKLGAKTAKFVTGD
jgi:tRNA(Ile)-lysidine synthetase-like protein